MKLISMTDFVLQNKTNFKGYKDEDYGKFAYNHMVRLENYAQFLKQPLTLGMFIPCDEDGQPLEEPKASDYPLQTGNYLVAIQNYQESKRCVLFEGFAFVKELKWNAYRFMHNGSLLNITLHNKTVESLFWLEPTLTDNAIKQLGL